jgi:mono/diheme cytochrome c family protein
VIRPALAVAAACVLAGAASATLPLRPAAPLADAEDPALVKAGQQVYAENCAGCHGRHRQGQPLWQAIDADSRRRAPALDETGHGWQHADAALVHVVEYGRFADGPADATMPAFRGRLGYDDILAVVAFLKAAWPIALRVSQASRNPGNAGMPEDATSTGWTFPADCARRNPVAARPAAESAR